MIESIWNPPTIGSIISESNNNNPSSFNLSSFEPRRSEPIRQREQFINLECSEEIENSEVDEEIENHACNNCPEVSK